MNCYRAVDMRFIIGTVYGSVRHALLILRGDESLSNGKVSPSRVPQNLIEQTETGKLRS